MWAEVCDIDFQYALVHVQLFKFALNAWRKHTPAGPAGARGRQNAGRLHAVASAARLARRAGAVIWPADFAGEHIDKYRLQHDSHNTGSKSCLNTADLVLFNFDRIAGEISQPATMQRQQ